MRIKEIMATVATLALTVAPALAQAVQPVGRAAAPVDDASSIGGGSSLLIIALVIALGLGIYFIARDKKPNSP